MRPLLIVMLSSATVMLAIVVASNEWVMSSTYDLRLASGCYSDEKRDKSDGRRYNSERRGCKSDVEEDKS